MSTQPLSQEDPRRISCDLIMQSLEPRRGHRDLRWHRVRRRLDYPAALGLSLSASPKRPSIAVLPLGSSHTPKKCSRSYSLRIPMQLAGVAEPFVEISTDHRCPVRRPGRNTELPARGPEQPQCRTGIRAPGNINLAGRFRARSRRTILRLGSNRPPPPQLFSPLGWPSRASPSAQDQFPCRSDRDV